MILINFLKIFIYTSFINTIICHQFDVYPYEAILPKVIRTECRSYNGRKVCAELYNFQPHPRIPDDYRWVESIYKPFIESIKLDEEDPLVGSIDYDYKSYASIVRNNCVQNCPILDIEETIPVVHIPFNTTSHTFSENSFKTDKYGNVKKYQKMIFINGKEYFVEVPKQKLLLQDDAYLCNEKRRGSVLYDNKKNPCNISIDGREHSTRPLIPIINHYNHLNLFDDNVFEICEYENGCKLTRYNIPFDLNRSSDIFREMYHKYGHLYEEKKSQTTTDIDKYSRHWYDSYKQEYDRQKEELDRGERNRHYSRKCYSTGRCRYINIQLTLDCNNEYDTRKCYYDNENLKRNNNEEYQRRIQIGRQKIDSERERIRIETELSRQRILQLKEYAKRLKIENEHQIQKIQQEIDERQRFQEQRHKIIDNDRSEQQQQYQKRDDLYLNDNNEKILSKSCNHDISIRSC
uniref:Inner membrane complex protein n=1 Tax=Strongyloides stercoralis TaxID=6248 RepID=A0A0K0E5C0_STRER